MFIDTLVSFLVILNPFALCLYLTGVMDDLDGGDFVRVLAWASFLSFVIFSLFALIGKPFVVNFMEVEPSALQIFGGVIIAVISYNYVVKGYRATVMYRGSLDDLPSAIAVPFMAGAGTITKAMLIGQEAGPISSILVFLISIVTCFVVVLIFRAFRESLQKKESRVFDRYINILSRVNGLLLGAIATEMILTGAQQLTGLK